MKIRKDSWTAGWTCTRSLLKNYRPVGLTSHIVKVFERVVRSALVKHLEGNNLLPNGQHGSQHPDQPLHNCYPIGTLFSLNLSRVMVWMLSTLTSARLSTKLRQESFSTSLKNVV